MDKNQGKKERKEFFIPVNGRLVPVTPEVYQDYYKMARRERYLEERDIANGLVSYDALDTDELLGEGLIADPNAECVEEAAIHSTLLAKLHRAMDALSEDEKILVNLVYFSNNRQGMTQREAAEILNISQPAVKKRHEKILIKLRNLMES